MLCSKVITSIGLLLDIVGAGIIMYPSSRRYFLSKSSKRHRELLEEEAINYAYARIAPAKREEQLKDTFAQGFLSTYRHTFWGFVLIILGFLFQLCGALVK